ncbi:MAG: futalosine hydrolase [Dactylosporangium sp.]|nr:futalosine hydrolase [Dactylosporangium sp.]NNJ59542.1 futalosine hydrolase [Dactylosporangium sp.]
MAFAGYRRVLVITAVDAERAAVLSGVHDHKSPPTTTVAAVGIGAAAAAATTARLLALAEAGGAAYEAVICAGIGGGFADRVGVGGLVIASTSIAADLGAADLDGFRSLDELGLGSTRVDADPVLLAALGSALPGAVTGPVLTVGTVTGTDAAADAMLIRHPDAVAEAMEGHGVGLAAAAAGAAFGELRAISNQIGPRDRAAWRVPEALRTLAGAFAAL